MSWAGQAAPAAPVDVQPLLQSGVLPTQARWFSSPTADWHLLSGGELEEVDALQEGNCGRDLADSPGFTTAIAAFLRDGVIPDGADWETRVDVTLRIVNITLSILAAFPGENVVLVGHGIAFTLLVAALTGSKPDIEAWLNLRPVDHCALVLLPEDSFEIISDWGAWSR